MDALFIVPALVSPNVHPKIVPALAKTVERNILLTHSSSFKVALLRKYRNASSIAEAGTFTIGKGNKNTGNRSEYKVDLPKVRNDKSGSKESDIYSKTGKTASKDAIEYPSGLTFFNTIGLEPTVMLFPISLKKNKITSVATGSEIERVFSVGIKVVPFFLDDVSNILNLIKDDRGRKTITQQFKRKFPRIFRKIRIPRIPISDDTPQEVKDIVMAPSSDDLSDPRKLAKQIGLGKRGKWAPIAVLSTDDFNDDDLRGTIRDYKKLVRQNWGDIIIINEVTESAYFCTQSLQACYDMPFSYMRNIMNIDNILDERSIKHLTSPFSTKSFRNAFKESVETKMNINTKILNIIKGD